MNTKETIVVDFPGKFGPNVKGVFYSIDQRSGLRPEQFEKSKTYEVLTYSSKSGKKYITQIIGQGADKVTDTSSRVKVELAGDDKILRSETTSTAKTVTGFVGKRDFDAEARGKIACALRAALYASPALSMYSTSYEEWIKKIDEEVKRGSEEVLKAQRGE